MYHFSNHQLYHQNTYQHNVFVEPTKHHNHSVTADSSVNQYELVQNNATSIQPEVTEAPTNVQTVASSSEKRHEVINKSSVDTSSFSIEERLVAAVWVHERKTTKSSMSQIKHDFRQRFGREPPTKNTLLVWERKLFATGSVHDAPRPGRPVNRRKRMEEVAASVRAAPALSLRARALALRLPRTTLRTILRTDLKHYTHATHAPAGLKGKRAAMTGKRTKQNAKKPARRKIDPQCEHAGNIAPTQSDTYT